MKIKPEKILIIGNAHDLEERDLDVYLHFKIPNLHLFCENNNTILIVFL